MPTTSPVETSVFDFVDDFARRITRGDPKPLETVAESSSIITFCKSFFDQFFASVLDCPITSFDPDAKRQAARLAEQRRGDPSTPDEVRRLITLFEKFCDMYQGVIRGSYGAEAITYAEFHRNYVRLLLDRALQWAQQAQQQALADRIILARRTYADAVAAMKW